MMNCITNSKLNSKFEKKAFFTPISMGHGDGKRGGLCATAMREALRIVVEINKMKRSAVSFDQIGMFI
jgi:hypothetical protein